MSKDWGLDSAFLFFHQFFLDIWTLWKQNLTSLWVCRRLDIKKPFQWHPTLHVSTEFTKVKSEPLRDLWHHWSVEPDASNWSPLDDEWQLLVDLFFTHWDSKTSRHSFTIQRKCLLQVLRSRHLNLGRSKWQTRWATLSESCRGEGVYGQTGGKCRKCWNWLLQLLSI